MVKSNKSYSLMVNIHGERYFLTQIYYDNFRIPYEGGYYVHVVIRISKRASSAKKWKNKSTIFKILKKKFISGKYTVKINAREICKMNEQNFHNLIMDEKEKILKEFKKIGNDPLSKTLHHITTLHNELCDIDYMEKRLDIDVPQFEIVDSSFNFRKMKIKELQNK